jgi:hypothetical protein
MAIIQISKIQIRSGNLVDLPQLSEAEMGFASDAKQLFIGKTSTNENIEVLTGYSSLDFSQVVGSGGSNMNITAPIQDGQVMTYDISDNSWTNRGGTAPGNINLGSISNIRIANGAQGYVLSTDGLGNLSWTSKGTLYANIIAISTSNTFAAGSFVIGDDYQILVLGNTNWGLAGAVATAVVTGSIAETIPVDGTGTMTVTGATSGLLTVGAQLEGTGVVPGTTITSFLSGTGGLGTYVVSNNTVVNSTTISAFLSGYSFTATSAGSGTGTAFSASIMTVANTTPYTSDLAVTITGLQGTASTGINGKRFYVKVDPNFTGAGAGSGNVTLYTDQAMNTLLELDLDTANSLASYTNAPNAIATSMIYGGSGSFAGGANGTIQFNNNDISDGAPGFIYDLPHANVNLTGNLNATINLVAAGQLKSKIVTGTSPIVVTSTTFVPNLYVSQANTVDAVDTSTNHTYFPTFVYSSTANANYAVYSNTNLQYNAFTNELFSSNLRGIFANGTSNISIPSSGGNVNTSVGGVANIFVVTSTGANLAGTANVTGNANVGNLSTPGLITATGNITGGNLKTTGTANIGTLLVTGTTNLNNVGNITITGGSNGQVLMRPGTTDGVVAWGIPFANGLVNSTSDPYTSTSNILFAGSGPMAVVNISAGGVPNRLIIMGSQLGGNGGGQLNGSWSLGTGSTLEATYADLAEYYTADAIYETGTVLEFGGDNEVTLASDGSSRVAGVVSTNPAYVMNSMCKGDYPVAIALQGRIPVKVRGTIQKGDMLISGGNGYARPSNSPIIGTIIGKSLENFSGVGIIEVSVSRN